MQLTKTHKIIISVIAVAILLGVYIYFDRKSRSEVNNSADYTNKVSTTTSGAQINVQGNGGYKIEQVPVTEGQGVPQPVPDLNRPITPEGSAKVSPEAVVRATENIPALQAQLKKNPSDFSSWLNLGIYQKMAGDYAGAVLSWQYAGKLAPTSYIPPGNLGDLYSYFLKDNIKAEMYYKQAISKGPTQTNLYLQLAEVYQYLFKDLDKARAIIDQGLSKIPNDTNLLQIKASLK